MRFLIDPKFMTNKMNFKKYLFFVFFLLISFVYAQQFQSIYFNHHGNAYAAQLSDSKFLICFPYDSLIIKTSMEGEIIWKREFPFSIERFINLRDGNILATGSVKGISGKEGIIAKLNVDGDTLWTVSVATTEEVNILDLRETLDGDYLFLIRENLQGFTKSFFTLFDPDGNFLWNRPASLVDGFCTTHDSAIISIGMDKYSNSLSVSSSDKYGILRWIKNFNSVVSSADYYSAESIIESSDSLIIIAGFYHQGVVIDINSPFIMKVDPFNGNKLSVKHFPSGTFSRIINTADHGYVVLGNDTDKTLQLTKLDDDLKIEWQKKFLPRGVRPLHISQTVDGGFLISASLTDSLSNTYPYIIKTDALGKTSAMNSFTETISNPELVDVYPNPSNSSITLELKDIFADQILVYNDSGQLVESQKVMSSIIEILVDKKSSGNYFFDLRAKNVRVGAGKFFIME
jgi:hypothetical protein